MEVSTLNADPISRYAAAAVLVGVFFACLAIVVHGFWLNPEYQIPPLLQWILGSGVTGASTLLGFHFGGIAMKTGAEVALNGINGKKTA